MRNTFNSTTLNVLIPAMYQAKLTTLLMRKHPKYLKAKKSS
jgi:hypothetical protein